MKSGGVNGPKPSNQMSVYM